MPTNTSRGDFCFDHVIERPRSAPFGGRFGIIVGLLLLLIALAAAFPVPRSAVPQAGEPHATRAA